MAALRYLALLCLASFLLVGALDMESSQSDEDQEMEDSSNAELNRSNLDGESADEADEEEGDGDEEEDDDDEDNEEDEEGVDKVEGAVSSVHQAGVSSGATYVRWGRTTCAAGAFLLYSGSAAGQYFGHGGGAGNPLCLPNKPIYDKYSKHALNFLYGAEYQISALSSAPYPYSQYHDNDVPCAVCMAEGRKVQFMVPARNVCPPDWHQEYAGYLTSGHYGHPGREKFTCLDKDAEIIPNSKANTDGYLFYTVGVHCYLGINCTPGGYIHNHELTCSVCSR